MRYNNKLNNIRENLIKEITNLVVVFGNITKIDEEYHDLINSCDIPIDDYEMSHSMNYVSIVNIVSYTNGELTFIDDNNDEYDPTETTIEGLASIKQWLTESIINWLWTELQSKIDAQHIEITQEDAENALNLALKGSTIENAVDTIINGIHNTLN